MSFLRLVWRSMAAKPASRKTCVGRDIPGASRMSQKILIIEDEEGIIHLLNLYLKDAGYTVVAAHDGADGLALHAREHPDLVILDIMLPALNGFEVCRRMRTWSKTPILMLTARS